MDVSQIIRIFEKRIKDYGTKDIVDYVAAQKYAQKTGQTMADVICQFVDVSTLTEETAVPLVTRALQVNYSKIAKVCRKVQRATNDRAKIGLGVLDAEFDAQSAREVALSLVDAQELTKDYVRNLFVNHSNKIVDESMRRNIEAQENVGLYVHITRKYDDVGLHGGKDVCQWCLEREGVWDDYQEAYDAGAFERHPGCGCVITYEVGSTRVWSGGGWKWNELSDIGQ